MDGKRINRLADTTPKKELEIKIAELEAGKVSKGVAKSIRMHKAALGKVLEAETHRAPEVQYTPAPVHHRRRWFF